MLFLLMLCNLAMADLTWSFGLTGYAPSNYILGNTKIEYKQPLLKNTYSKMTFQSKIQPEGYNDVVLNSNGSVKLGWKFRDNQVVELGFGRGSYYGTANNEYSIEYIGILIP